MDTVDSSYVTKKIISSTQTITGIINISIMKKINI